MEPHAHRNKTRQLADDLGWLEEHCRKNADLKIHAAHLRLASALTRNVIGPAVDGQPPRPLYLAVVGGAGAGKSTIVNFLAGTVIADANPQAGFTRHPTAFLPAHLASAWPSLLGFLGPLQRLSEDRPANLDEDVYQVKRLQGGSPSDPLAEFVIWDCPDMTTWASEHYVSRLMEVVALADMVIYVASDERYNDEVPTQYLHMLVKAGKAVVCCLTKMREADSAALVDHFRREVLGRLPTTGGEIPPIPVVPLPHMPLAVRNDPGGSAAAVYRVPLINQLLAICPTAELARARTVRNAVRYLELAGEGLLTVARRDLSEFDVWRGLVNAGRVAFEERYRQEYLAGEAFRRFDKTREQVMAMLELPGPGRTIGAAFALLRTPYRYLRDYVGRTFTRPAPPNLSELTVCTSAMAAWLDSLQAEAMRRTPNHPLWKQVTHGFDSVLKTQAADLFQKQYREFELKEADDLDKAARAVPEALTHSPATLNLLRVGALVLDIAVIVIILWITWLPSWYHFLLLPLGVSLTHHAVELIVTLIVDAGRNRLRNQRERILSDHLSGPIAAWLSDWPSSGGSSLEKLQTIIRRVPELIQELAAMTQPAAPTPALAAPTTESTAALSSAASAGSVPLPASASADAPATPDTPAGASLP